MLCFNNWYDVLQHWKRLTKFFGDHWHVDKHGTPSLIYHCLLRVLNDFQNEDERWEWNGMKWVFLGKGAFEEKGGKIGSKVR